MHHLNRDSYSPRLILMALVQYLLANLPSLLHQPHLTASTLIMMGRPETCVEATMRAIPGR